MKMAIGMVISAKPRYPIIGGGSTSPPRYLTNGDKNLSQYESRNAPKIEIESEKIVRRGISTSTFVDLLLI